MQTTRKERNKWSKRDRKTSKRRHGMRVDKRPTDIGNSLTKRVRKDKNK
jgi:hypothetical protein